MPIIKDLSSPVVTLQFPDSKGDLIRLDFNVDLVDDPAAPDALGFEIFSDAAKGLPVWACTLRHPDGDQFRLVVGGTTSAGPIISPLPETWLFPGDPDPKFHLYFELKSGRTFYPADNSVPEGVEAGYPLQLMVYGGPVRGKKIKILYPGLY